MFVKISGEEGFMWNTGRRMNAPRWSLRNFMHSSDKIFQSIYSIYKSDGYCQSRVICHGCKGNFDFTTKDSLFLSVIFSPISVCTHIKTHFKFIPVLHFQTEEKTYSLLIPAVALSSKLRRIYSLPLPMNM